MKATLPSSTAKCWDAGAAGCGKLILGLKRQVETMCADEILSVTALDPAAHIDLDHWCHMTGHALVTANHPNYVLRIKG